MAMPSIGGSGFGGQDQALSAIRSRYSRRRCPSPPERSVPAEALVLVLCAAVLRVLKNPDGKQREQLEDYSYQMADGAASGTLYLTDEELLVLRPSSPSPSGAFTIRPYGKPDPL